MLVVPAGRTARMAVVRPLLASPRSWSQKMLRVRCTSGRAGHPHWSRSPSTSGSSSGSEAGAWCGICHTSTGCSRKGRKRSRSHKSFSHSDRPLWFTYRPFLRCSFSILSIKYYRIALLFIALSDLQVDHPEPLLPLHFLEKLHREAHQEVGRQVEHFEPLQVLEHGWLQVNQEVLWQVQPLKWWNTL